MVEPLEAPIPAVSADHVRSVARDCFGLEGTSLTLGGERDLNVMIDTGVAKYVLKFSNAETSHVHQHAALTHIRTTDPSLAVPRPIPARHGATVEIDGDVFHVSATTFLEGIPLPSGPIDAAAGRAVGRTLGRLQHALRGFIHPGVLRPILWDARRADEIIDWTGAIPTTQSRTLAAHTLRSVAGLRPDLARLPGQTIHNDFNRGNLLVAHDDPAAIMGVLDFGDMIHAPRVQDLAVAVAYAALAHPEPAIPAQAVVAGFCEVAALEPDELEMLPGLVKIRLAQSLTIAHHRAALHPENAAYILADAPAVEDLLHRWTAHDGTNLLDAMHAAAGTPRRPERTARLLERRSTNLWSGLRLMYAEPLHLIRGDGVWLYDADDRRYLDAYNNVVQVGHGNNRVIAAATAQARRLNTNTRYLTDPVVRLAEAVSQRLPDPLEVCLFVNSGTEANDLAWRIARAVTGNDGAVVTQHAYHGWTDATYALSPEERPASEAPGYVATMAAPGGTGPDCHDALQTLAAAGHAPAAVWFDATFASDGIHVPPSGYLNAVSMAVHDRGGLSIADEVQGGLGRVGSTYWSFAGDGTVPDIVTLGKPLGNGYPIGAVITTRPIADRFAETGYFFSTFGGNPVSAAAASMVLHITDELALASRAERVGRLLRDALPAALAALPVEFEVRGRGAFIGIEMGSADVARGFVEAMRRNGVLVSRTGPGGTVVKIRPPLIFDTEHALRCIEAADASARAVADHS